MSEAGDSTAVATPSLWRMAELAAALVALDPAGIGDARLLGGLDLTATLASGRPVAERGLLAQADGGVVLAAMAERVSPATAARIALALDSGEVAVSRDGLGDVAPSRFGLVAFDEGIVADERPPEVLTERLALRLDLGALSHRDIEPAVFMVEDVAEARQRLSDVEIDDAAIEALCTAALSLGIGSARAALQAVRVARMIAALMDRDVVGQEDVALAAALVLAPRATQMPATAEDEAPPPPQEQPDDPPPHETQSEDKDQPADLDDLVLEAAKAAIPAGLLAQLLAQSGRVRARSSGKAGQFQKAALRGRIIGSKAGELRGGVRLDVVETLRAAAPWQALRRREPGLAGRAGIIVRRDDFRVARYKQRSETATLFVVDASGSSALQRLAEAKGAVRLLLAECYIRRDEVALIAFRKTEAELVLPPTRSLVAAERALAALPGGGATPLATAIGAAAALADVVRRKGRTPAIVFMTDGRANIDRDGQPGRAKAQADAMTAAKALRGEGVSTLLIDTSPQPTPQAAELSDAMGARYVPLPHADAAGVSRAVTALLPGR